MLTGVWISRAATMVVSLPITVVLIGMIAKPKSDPSALSLGLALGFIGLALAVATFIFVVVATNREIKSGSSAPVGFDARMTVCGLSALGIYILVWFGMLTWIVV